MRKHRPAEICALDGMKQSWASRKKWVGKLQLRSKFQPNGWNNVGGFHPPYVHVLGWWKGNNSRKHRQKEGLASLLEAWDEIQVDEVGAAG